MLTFGIDTCCMASTAALVDDRVLVAQMVTNRKKTHSEMMMPQIEQMFKSAEIDPMEVDVFAAAVGPGSFTGVRIGVATAKAMAQAAGKPCVAVSTLEALAHSSRFFDGIVSPILDARRGQVYNALFDSKKGSLLRLTEDRALALEDLIMELKTIDRDVIFMGDGVLAFEDEVRLALGERAFFSPKTTSMNLGGAVAEIGARIYKNGGGITYGELVPSYIRLSQAERDLLEKNKNL